MCLARHLFKIVYSTKSISKEHYVGPCRLQFKSTLQDVQNVNDLKKGGIILKSILFLFSRAATSVFT